MKFGKTEKPKGHISLKTKRNIRNGLESWGEGLLPTMPICLVFFSDINYKNQPINIFNLGTVLFISNIEEY